MRNNRGSIQFLFLSFLIISIVSLGGLSFFLLKGTPSSRTKDLLIPRGLSLKAVTELLQKEDLIRHPQLFRMVLRVTGGDKKVRAGEFRFYPGANLLFTLKTLYYSDPITHGVTIPEGWTVKQIAGLLEEKGLGSSKKFQSLALSSETAQKYRVKSPHLEGYLYPDTYFFSKIDSESKMLEAMVKRFFQEINSRFKDSIQKSVLSLEEIVTLASIVEKETGKPSERPLIASVFFNRLKKGMRLQSDPTTIYGIKDFNGNITKADLLTWTPYNTYRISGLPPGPIASPGGDAIAAVLAPEPSDYLYFVSRNDGSHVFSKTYQEHLKYVRDYQIYRRKK